MPVSRKIEDVIVKIQSIVRNDRGVEEMTTILDPTDERVPVTRTITTRPASISGNVAFLDISKPRGNVLIDRLEELLAQRLPDVTFNRYAKPTFTKPAPEELRQQINAENDFVVEAWLTGALPRAVCDTVWFEIQGTPAVPLRLRSL